MPPELTPRASTSTLEQRPSKSLWEASEEGDLERVAGLVQRPPAKGERRPWQQRAAAPAAGAPEMRLPGPTSVLELTGKSAVLELLRHVDANIEGSWAQCRDRMFTP